MALSAISGVDYAPRADSGDHAAKLPVSTEALEHPKIKKALTRSSTTSSVEDWPGLKKNKPDMRLPDYVDKQKPIARRQTLSAQLSLPRISSFLTEKEFRAKNKSANAVASDVMKKVESISEVAPSSNVEPQSPRKERPSFIRSISRKSLRSHPSTPTADTGTVPDPLAQAGASVKQRQPSTPKSPNKIYGGLLWQSRKKSGDMEPPPALAKSRRTGTFDEPVMPPSQAPSRPLGVPELGTPDMKATRPPLPAKYPSSQISPHDTSAPSTNPYASSRFEQAIEECNRAKQMALRATSKKFPKTPAPSERKTFLAKEAVRINTPPVFKPGKGNRLIPHFFDHKAPDVEDPRSATTNMKTQHIHTPFPMPADPLASPRIELGDPFHVQRTADWYRVRADEFLDDDEQDHTIEDLKAMLDWDIPEHLPNSPLCPANPKHRSGGTGVCVYHGRAKPAEHVVPETSNPALGV